jgi:mannan endo-1,4-beta-mannosidase
MSFGPIAHLVNRRNTITGVLYRDDKAILCWETGNELESPPSWTKNIAAYIKSLDPVHPVMDGYYATGMLREESLTMPEVDIVSTHHYPNVSKDFAWLVRANAEKAKGRKPYIVGEFGFLPTSQMLECVNTVKQTGVCGAMLWSLRPHNRDGGFYWHSEPTGGDKYKAFHWPGSPCGEDYDEMSLMQKMRKLAFEIRGLPVPEVAVPGAPTLLPFDDPGGISWQGSAGAESYDVERASTKRGPWVKAGVGVDESLTQYRPQFSDETATQGRWFYRVRAGNVAGLSKPSNVVGPINVKHVTLVDEMSDFSRLYACAGDLQIVSRDCRAAREDAHRVVGQEGTELVYQVSGKIINMRVFVFFPGEIADLKFGLSKDGKSFRMAAAPRNDFKEAKGDYHYMGSAIYTLDEVGADDHFVKISFAGEAQISRIEIQQLANKR